LILIRLATHFGRRSRDHKFDGGFFMRSKLLTLFMAVAVAVALAAEFSVAAFVSQENANKAAAPMKRKMRKPRRAAAQAAIPATPQDCLNRLATLAAREPLPAYDGEPSKIINEGLLWTDAKAKCPVTDQAQRLKLFDLGNKWRVNDAAGVRAALQELGATAEAAPAAMPKPRKRRPMKAKAKAANTNSGV
jgi:hypothetical protein